MKAVKVQYTVRPEYVETNINNIQQVMAELERNPIEGMWYKAFLLEDGQTFMHLNISADEATMDKINEVAQFNAFRGALMESNPPVPPKLENLTLIPEKE